MGGGRGGVVREVREHSSVALAINFLSFPIPILWLFWRKIKAFAIFRFLCKFLLLEIKKEKKKKNKTKTQQNTYLAVLQIVNCNYYLLFRSLH